MKSDDAVQCDCHVSRAFTLASRAGADVTSANTHPSKPHGLSTSASSSHTALLPLPLPLPLPVPVPVPVASLVVSRSRSTGLLALMLVDEREKRPLILSLLDDFCRVRCWTPAPAGVCT